MELISLIIILAAWLIQATKNDFKPIPDLAALGYTIQGSTPVSGDWVHFDVSYGATFLADLAVYKDGAQPTILAVFDAHAEDDVRPEALPLRDILLGTWVRTILRPAATLFAIRYLDVWEPTLLEVTHRVYELMGQKESQDLT